MLNCFYWYSIIWSAILVLYNFKLSMFNHDLNNGLLIFLIITIIISFIIGFINKDKIKYSKTAVDYGIKPVIIIAFLFILNFIYAKSVPLISIISGSSNYGDFVGIPTVYVILNAIAFYFGVNYFNAYLNINNNKKRNLICFIIIVLMYLFAFSRSTVLFLIGGAFILYIMSKRENSDFNKKRKNRKIVLIILFTFVVLYSFGALGNIRSGYKYNDNSYIERIGLYTKYPSILPKQFMWSYSYLTSPLANLNYTVSKNKEISLNIKGFIVETLNITISKRIFPDISHGEDAVVKIGIEHEYFNAPTGYFMMYNYAGYLGMFIQYIILIVVSNVQIYLSSKDYNSGKRNCTFIILLLANILMFFYNSLNTTTVSWWLIINFVVLLKKPKIKWR